MTNKSLYEKYHNNIRLQKRIIDQYDFTYRNTLSKIQKYIPRSGRVLDVGSATGTVSFYFAARGLIVDGIELSKNAIKYAQLNKKKLGLKNVRFYNQPIESLKFNLKYDLIVCLEVLEHVENDIEVLNLLRRMMSDKSKLIITVPSSSSPLYKLGLLKKFDDEVGHLRRYSSYSLKKILHRTGFNIESEYYSEGIVRSLIFTNKIFGLLVRLTRFRLINNFLNTIDKLSLYFLGESQLIFVCSLNRK